jgi:hypothetical protein
VTWAIEEKSYSQVRACALIGLAPKTYRYASKRESDAAIRERLCAFPCKAPRACSLVQRRWLPVSSKRTL